MIKVENISYKYGKNEVLDNINFSASSEEVTVIVGSNGTGKSTLLKNICGILNGKGNVYIDDINKDKYTKKELAKKISYLPQFNIVDADINVFEVVLLGRIDNLSFRVPDKEIKKVWSILEFLNLDRLASRKITQLSGGQKQMVFIGQALAREPEVLILDEPTNNLDLRYSFKILQMIQSLTKEHCFTTIMVLHDLSLIERFADQVIVLKDKKVYQSGPPKNILTKQMFKDVYKMNVDLYNTKEGYKAIVPISACN